MAGYDPNHFYRDTDPITDNSGHTVDPTGPSADLARTGLPGKAGSGQALQLPRSLSMEQIAAIAKESENMSPESRRAVEKMSDQLKMSNLSQEIRQNSR